MLQMKIYIPVSPPEVAWQADKSQRSIQQQPCLKWRLYCHQIPVSKDRERCAAVCFSRLQGAALLALLLLLPCCMPQPATAQATAAAAVQNFTAADVRRVALASGRGAAAALRSAVGDIGWQQAAASGVPIDWGYIARNPRVAAMV